MKKLISLMLALVLVVATLAGCGSSKTSSNSSSTSSSSTSSSSASSSSQASSGEVKLGLGHKVDISGSTNATAEKAGQVQVNNVMAAVVVGSDGKIVDVKIDNAQVKVAMDATGKVTTDLKAAQQTKVELGDKYGMKKNSTIGKEWYEQIAELEKWMIGKTVDEIKGMKTVKKDDSHTAVPDEEDLKTKVTISVEDYIFAVEEAVKNAVAVSGSFGKLGLGHDIDIASSKDAAADKEGQAQVNVVMAATAFDNSGKVLATKIDNAQTKVNFDAKGQITTDLKAAQQTKVELGDKYGMKSQSKIGKEWYEQIAELEKWMAGKTVDQIKGMKTVKKDDSHTAVPDEEDLKTKVTVSVEDYIFAVEEAYKNAK